MKINKQEAKSLKESHQKWLNEAGFLGNLFLRNVVKDIKKDKSIQKAIEDADKSLAKTRKEIEKYADGDKDTIKKALPKDVRKSLGFDF